MQVRDDSNRVNGIVFSAFDLCHAGHLAMLREARASCDHLIVALQTDPTIDRPEKNKPVQTLMERFLQLQSVKWVDEIVVYETEADLVRLLQMLPVKIRFIGEEYKDKDFTGKQYCLDNDIELVYNRRQHGFSTSELRSRIVGTPCKVTNPVGLTLRELEYVKS